MEYKVKKNNNATAEITIHFTSQELENGFEKAYSKNKNKVKVPGFRPGKAPMEKIKKILGNSVIDDAIDFTLQDGIIEIFPKLDPRPLRIPKFSIKDEESGISKGFTVTAIYDTFPEISLPKLKKVKVDTYKVQLTETEIANELQTIQKSLSRNVLKEDTESVENNNLVEFNYLVSEIGNEFTGDYKQSRLIIGDQGNIAGFDSNLIGMKTGETKIFEYTFPAEFSESKEPEGKSFQYKVTITSAFDIKLPEINDEMASEFDGSESLEVLKKKIIEKVQKEINEKLRNKTIHEIYEKIIEESKFVFPESLIKEEAEFAMDEFFSQYNRKSVTLEKFSEMTNQPIDEVSESFRKAAIRRLQGYFLRLKIAENEKIEMTDEEFQMNLKSFANELGEDRNLYQKELEKEGNIDKLKNKFFIKKVNNYVYDSVEKKGPTTVNLESANKLLNNEEKAE